MSISANEIEETWLLATRIISTMSSVLGEYRDLKVNIPLTVLNDFTQRQQPLINTQHSMPVQFMLNLTHQVDSQGNCTTNSTSFGTWTNKTFFLAPKVVSQRQADELDATGKEAGVAIKTRTIKIHNKHRRRGRKLASSNFDRACQACNTRKTPQWRRSHGGHTV